jgi:hypothetical protein
LACKAVTSAMSRAGSYPRIVNPVTGWTNVVTACRCLQCLHSMSVQNMQGPSTIREVLHVIGCTQRESTHSHPSRAKIDIWAEFAGT